MITDKTRLNFIIDAEQDEDYKDAITKAIEEVALATGKFATTVSQIEYREFMVNCIDRAIEITGYAIAEGTIQ